MIWLRFGGFVLGFAVLAWVCGVLFPEEPYSGCEGCPEWELCRGEEECWWR